MHEIPLKYTSEKKKTSEGKGFQTSDLALTLTQFGSIPESNAFIRWLRWKQFHGNPKNVRLRHCFNGFLIEGCDLHAPLPHPHFCPPQDVIIIYYIFQQWWMIKKNKIIIKEKNLTQFQGMEKKIFWLLLFKKGGWTQAMATCLLRY